MSAPGREDIETHFPRTRAAARAGETVPRNGLLYDAGIAALSGSGHVGDPCPLGLTPLRLKSLSFVLYFSSPAAGRLRTCSVPRRRE